MQNSGERADSGAMNANRVDPRIAARISRVRSAKLNEMEGHILTSLTRLRTLLEAIETAVEPAGVAARGLRQMKLAVDMARYGVMASDPASPDGMALRSSVAEFALSIRCQIEDFTSVEVDLEVVSGR